MAHSSLLRALRARRRSARSPLAALRTTVVAALAVGSAAATAAAVTSWRTAARERADQLPPEPPVIVWDG